MNPVLFCFVSAGLTDEECQAIPRRVEREGISKVTSWAPTCIEHFYALTAGSSSTACAGWRARGGASPPGAFDAEGSFGTPQR